MRAEVTLRERAPDALRALTEEPPYHIFVATSLALAVGAGFVLATLPPLSLALDWWWRARYGDLARAHGQTQLLGWLGLFIFGMAYRLMPRFSGRPLRFPALVWLSWATLTASVALRLAAQSTESGDWRGGGLVASSALETAAAFAFLSIVCATLLHRGSRGGATSWFFLLGTSALALQAALRLAFTALMLRRGDEAIGPLEHAALLHLALYGFVLVVVLGVATRAVPTFSGLPRPEAGAKALALLLGAAVALYEVAALARAEGDGGDVWLLLEGAALAALGPLMMAGTWLAGVFRPAALRLRPASQQHIWFVRAAFAWLLVAGGLALVYGTRAALDGAPARSEGIDALRHTVGLGVASMMIMGMGLLVLPEFAIRRMRHPRERGLPLLMLTLLNAATALRVGAALASPFWPAPDRAWALAVAGGLAWLAVAIFALLFVQSFLQKDAIVASIGAGPPGAPAAASRAS